HLYREWLPGAGLFVPVPDRRRSTYRVERIADHPLFAGLSPEDLTWRRGVAGFFARGHHPVPDGAQVLTWLHHDRPATYLDRSSTAGTILVHATADLAGYLGDRLVDWILAEAAPVRPPRGGGLAAVFGGGAAHHRALTTPKYARHLTGGLRYLPDLCDADLSRLDGLIVPERLHRGMLARAESAVLGLLDAGGLVVAFSGGEPVPEFLPNVAWEHRPTNFWWWLDPDPAARLVLETPVPDHPFFQRLSLKDCTWHHHGVLDPPPGAQPLVTLPGGEVLLYVDRASTKGTLVVSALDPLWHYGSYFMPAAERFLDGFLPWVAAVADPLSRERAVPSY
ncbi:MAG: hypothetical protein ACT4QF_00720, partial [Sporichthyaceae bacterium]